MKTLAYSVTPSPYQRDFFHALAVRGDCDLTVAYFEEVPDDSPWRLGKLEPWETIMPGRVFGSGRVRCHWNSPLVDLRSFDAVMVNAPLTGITTRRIFRRLAARGAPPWVFWGERLLERRGWRGAIQRQLAAPVGNARAIVAIGRSARADYQRRFPQTPVHDIPYACALDLFGSAAANRRPSDTCRFLFAGQMIERKGVDILLEAFHMLHREGLDIELQLAGREGQLPKWLAGMDEAARAKVAYLGFKQPEALPEVFAGADVFVLPSRHDGWGVVVNQALGAGMPVISSTAAGAGLDLIEDGGSGFHVHPGSVDSLATAMRRLALDPVLRRSMSGEASRKAREIGPETAAERWMTLLRTLVRGAP